MSIAESNRSRRKTNRVNEIKYNKYGEKMTLIAYENAHDVIIEFESGYRINTQYINFELGHLKSPYAKTVFGIGFLGEGEYDPIINKDIYDCWTSMFKRCYGKNKYGKYDKSVCEDWCNFQNFAEWFENNYYEVDGERTELDKDILVKGNNVYSPETCLFVPRRINSLFVGINDLRELPKGVSIKNDKYVSKVQMNNKPVNLGYFDTPVEAWYQYKLYKELYIKQVADEYKEVIPKKLYNAMYNFEISLEVDYE